MKKMDREINKEIGARLKKYRSERGISQEKLATHLGKIFQQVQKYEKGSNRISVPTLYGISRFLNIDISMFFQELSKENHHENPSCFNVSLF